MKYGDDHALRSLLPCKAIYCIECVKRSELIFLGGNIGDRGAYDLGSSCECFATTSEEEAMAYVRSRSKEIYGIAVTLYTPTQIGNRIDLPSEYMPKEWLEKAREEPVLPFDRNFESNQEKKWREEQEGCQTNQKQMVNEKYQQNRNGNEIMSNESSYYLNEWRKQVLSGATLSERIETLRELVKLSTNWDGDLTAHESKRLDEIESGVNGSVDTVVLEAWKKELLSFPSSPQRDVIQGTIREKLSQIYLSAIKTEFEHRPQDDSQEEIDVLERILLRFVNQELIPENSLPLKSEVERCLEEIKIKKEETEFKNSDELTNQWVKTKALEGILNRLHNNKWSYFKEQALDLESRIERRIDEINIDEEKIKFEKCDNLPNYSEKVKWLEELLNHLRRFNWKHLVDQAQDLIFKVEQRIEEIKIKKEETEFKNSDNFPTYFEKVRAFEKILERLRNTTYSHLKGNANDLKKKVERRIEEVKFNEVEIEFENCNNLSNYSEKIKGLEEILNRLSSFKWNHLIDKTEDLQSQIKKQLEILHDQEKLAAWQKILNKLEETLPKSLFCSRKTFRTFDQNHKEWVEKTSLEPIPSDLQTKCNQLIRQRNKLYARKMITMTVVVLLLVTTLTIIAREYSYRRNLLATYMNFVKQKDILKTEEQYRLIEQSRPGIMKSASFVESRKIYEQLVEARKKWKQDFEAACAKIKTSIQNAEADMQNINAAALDRVSLATAKTLASKPLVPSDANLPLLESFEMDFATIERRASEQKRQKEFRTLLQQCDESILNAKENPKDYQPNALNESSLRMLTPVTDAEKDEKLRIQTAYDSVKAERIRQDHINELETLRAKISQSIEDATASNPYKPELLDRNRLGQLKAKAASDNEKEIVSDFERQFQSVQDAIVKQTFTQALKQASDSIEKAKEQSDETQLDMDALSVALKNAVSPDDHLAVEKIQQSFETTKQEVFARRKENLEKFVSEKRKTLEGILADSISSDDEKADKLTGLKDELEEEGKKSQALEKKGCITDKEARNMASALYLEVGNAIKRFQKAVTLKKLTGEIGDFQKYFQTMEEFVKQFPEDQRTPGFTALINQGKKAQESVELWNTFVRQNKSTIDLYDYSNENAKKIVEFLASPESKNFDVVPEFQLLQDQRKAIYESWANGFFPEVGVRDELTKYVMPGLLCYLSDQGQYYYLKNSLGLGTNQCLSLGQREPVQLVINNNLQSHLSKVIRAPQAALAEGLILKLKQSPLQNEQVIDKNWYLLWDEVLQTILQDKKTDPVIKCVFIDEIFRRLSNIEPFFAQYANQWQTQKNQRGFRISTDWSNPNRPELNIQRTVASELLKNFPFGKITEGIKNASSFPFRFPQHAAVEYVWVGIIASDGNNAIYIDFTPKVKQEKNLNEGTWYVLMRSTAENSLNTRSNPPKSNTFSTKERYTIQEIKTIKPQSGNVERIPLPESYSQHIGSPVYLKNFEAN